MTYLERHFSKDELELIADRPLFGPDGLRRELAALDFEYFREAYFRHWMTDEETGEYIPPARFHNELATRYEAVVNSDGGNRYAMAAPRGNAKSTSTDVFFVSWCILYEYKRYILLIMDTHPQAKLQLDSVKHELETNEAILEDFGDLKGETWQEDTIVTANGVRVEALGAGMKVRGRRWKQYRPDLILCDDLENDENVATPGQRRKLESWYWKAVEKAGNRRTDIFVIGTILHYDSLLKKLLQHHRYKAQVYRALISEPENKNLWDEWEQLLTNLNDPSRGETALAFYMEHKEEMDEGAEVLWPEKEPLYDLMLQRVDDSISFAFEKQNEPLNLEDCLFDENTFSLIPVSLEELWQYHLFGACDPSLGKSGKRGDYSALIDLLVHKETGQKVVYWASIERRVPDVIISDVLARAQWWARRGIRYRAYGVETNQFQAFFKDQLAKTSMNAKSYIPFVELPHSVLASKHQRIQSLQPEIKNKYIGFVPDLKNSLLWNQLKFFPLADHDDGPDALEMANSLANTGGHADEDAMALLRGAKVH